MLKTTVVIFVVLTTCQALANHKDWAERRWEARFDACENADSYVLIRWPDDQKCKVLCGLFPPRLADLQDDSVCKTRKGEPGTCNRGECFARKVDIKPENEDIYTDS